MTEAGIVTINGVDFFLSYRGAVGSNAGVLFGLSKDTISDSSKVIDSSFVFDFDDLLVGFV